MWLLLAVLLALGLMLANPVRAQTSVPPPGSVPPVPAQQAAPTLPPGAGGDTTLARPLPDTAAAPPVVRPPATGDMPVISPPATGAMPVIPPPGTAGGDKSVAPK